MVGAGTGRPSLAGRWVGAGSGGRHLLQLRLDVDPGGLGIGSGDLYDVPAQVMQRLDEETPKR